MANIEDTRTGVELLLIHRIAVVNPEEDFGYMSKAHVSGDYAW